MQRIGRVAGALFSLTAIAAAIVAIVLTAQRLDHRPRTDDAFIDADVVHMAPDVSGRVVALNVRDNQPVRAGDVLFTIDPEPFRLQLAQARAQLAGLIAQLDVTTDQVASQNSKADAANTQIGSAQAQLSLATSTLARLTPLLLRGFVTPQQVDQARTSQRTAQIALQQARQQAQEAKQGVTSVKPVEQQIAAARAALALAERN
jgi:multidrug efflux system membrane fusion protein